MVVPSASEPELLRDLLAAVPGDAPFTLLVLSVRGAAPAVPAALPQGVPLLRLSPEEAIAQLGAGRNGPGRDGPSGAGGQEAAAVLLTLLQTRGREAAAVALACDDPKTEAALAAIDQAGGFAVVLGPSGTPAGAAAPQRMPPAEVPPLLLAFFDQGQPGSRLQPELSRILGFLGERTGNDFSGYKASTLSRRVALRMQGLGLSDIAEYAAVVQEDPEEAERLLDSLLIKVTGFFRDSMVFEALAERVLPGLIGRAGAGEEIRAWVPGCATGEEVYSLAMLLNEALDAVPEKERPVLKLFASDIDDAAIRAARTAVFPQESVSTLSVERLARFFVPVPGGLKIAKPIRESVVFTHHNIISDPPFSRLDLISCRNLLIYLDQAQQDRVLSIFHYALRPGGVLLLGSAESILHSASLFEPIDSVRRLFRRRDVPSALPSVGGAEDRRSFPARIGVRASRVAGPVAAAQRLLLDHYTPAYLVLGTHRELLYASPRIGRYLEIAAGPPTTDVLTLTRQPLRQALESLLDAASGSGRRTVRRDVELREDGGSSAVDLIAAPLEGGQMLIVFQDVSALRDPTQQHERVTVSVQERDRERVQELEVELRAVYDRLSRSVEDLGAANEELQSSNEEMVSVNQELQTTNQQLEEAQTGLQAAKHQLERLNDELREKIVALEAASSDLQNFFDSAEIAILFFDSRLTLRRHTVAAETLLQVSADDTGRPLREIATIRGLGDMASAAGRVLRSLQIEESEVVLNGGELVLHLRILPYRTIEGAVRGVVLTVVDLSRTRVAEARARQLDRALQARVVEVEALLDLVPVGVAIAGSADFSDVRLNRRGRDLLAGVLPSGTGEAFVHTPSLRVEKEGRPVVRDDWPLERAVRTGEPVGQETVVIRHVGGEPLELSVSAAPLFGPDGRVRGGIAAFEDISQSLERERRLERLVRQHHAVAALGAKALEGKPLAPLMDEAVVRLQQALGVDCVKVLELLPDGRALRMCAGVGWRDGLVKVATVENDRRSQAGFTLETDAPVVVTDFDTERRFLAPELLISHGVRSGMSTVVVAGERRYGVLGIHAREPRVYTDDEVDFLRSVANILAAAIRRSEDRQALSGSEARNRRLIETASDAILVVALSEEGRDVIAGANPAAAELLGYPAAALQALAPSDVAEWPPALREQLQQGDAVRRETVYRSATGEEIPVEESLALLSPEGGGTLVAIARDIRERRRAERRQRLLMHELQHRIKNTLATIRSLVYLSGRGKHSVADFVQSFDGRLQAMTRGQNLVLLNERPTVSLDHIVREELAPFLAAEKPPVEIEGEPLQVPTRLGLPLSMALHELTSNAARHGALSRPEGRVGVGWSIAGERDNRTLVFRWEERGGPPVKGPIGSGFGRTLLERGLAYELRGEASLNFDESGVRYRLSVPLDELERMLDQQMLDLEDEQHREERQG